MNRYFENLKRFNHNVPVWAVPRKGTEEMKILQSGKRFNYTLLKDEHPELHKQIVGKQKEGRVSSEVGKIEMKIKHQSGK